MLSFPCQLAHLLFQQLFSLIVSCLLSYCINFLTAAFLLRHTGTVSLHPHGLDWTEDTLGQ